MSFGQLPKTMNERRPNSVRVVYGRVGAQPIRLDIPVEVLQIRAVDDVRDLPEFDVHARTVDMAWGDVVFELTDLVTARPVDFVEITREQFHAERSAREANAAEVRESIALARELA